MSYLLWAYFPPMAVMLCIMLFAGWYTIRVEKEDVKLKALIVGCFFTFVPLMNWVGMFISIWFIYDEFGDSAVLKAKK